MAFCTRKIWLEIEFYSWAPKYLKLLELLMNIQLCVQSNDFSTSSNEEPSTGGWPNSGMILNTSSLNNASLWYRNWGIGSSWTTRFTIVVICPDRYLPMGTALKPNEDQPIFFQIWVSKIVNENNNNEIGT